MTKRRGEKQQQQECQAELTPEVEEEKLLCRMNVIRRKSFKLSWLPWAGWIVGWSGLAWKVCQIQFLLPRVVSH